MLMYDRYFSQPRYPRLRRFMSDIVPWIICPPLVIFSVYVIYVNWTEQEESEPEEPPGLAVLEWMCEDPKPVPGAAPYEGEGPHRYYKGLLGGTDTVDDSDELPVFDDVPHKWVAEDLDITELVVCVDIELAEYLSMCEYTGQVRLALFAAEYKFRIYSASNGELMDKTTKHADDPTCPDTAVKIDGEFDDIYAALGDDVAKKVIEPWVTKTVK